MVSSIAGELTWTKANVAAPPARMGGTIVYDEARDETLAFGGVGTAPAGLLNDLWSWDGGKWAVRPSLTAPSPRVSCSIAYDPAASMVLLFGGSDGHGQVLGDTWSWDGQDWFKIESPISPSPRTEAAMFAVPSLGHILLFGGRQYVRRKSVWLSDTWIWNGTTWSQYNAKIAPSSRSGAALAYDEQRQAAVLFGGTDSAPLGDTWIWGPLGWKSQMLAANPAARSDAAFAFLGTRGVAVIYGGRSSGIEAPFYLSDLWLWNGQQWHGLSLPGSPSSAHNTVAAYGPGRSSLVALVSSVQKQVDTASGRPSTPVISTDTWLLT